MQEYAKNANITLTDVARSAGVSQSTVSRAISQHPRISDVTRQRIFKVIHELGYDMQSIEEKAKARARKNEYLEYKRIEIILCPLPEQKNILALHFYSEIIEGIQGKIRNLPLLRQHVSVWELGEDLRSSNNTQTLQRLSRSDGALVLGNPSDELVERFVRINRSCVFVSTGRDNPSIDSVGSDNIVGGMQAARYLIEQGHRKIGFLEGSTDVLEWRQRKSGVLLEVIETLGGPEFFESRCSASTELSDIARTAEQWLGEPDAPKALILPYADAVLAVEMTLKKLGMSCPGDLSLLVFDKPRLSLFDIKPTYLETYAQRIGEKAFQRLEQIIGEKKEDRKPHHTVIPMQLVEGNSVKHI
jgi:DNA-binding LacI/PurR family transcriptional regulator